MRFTLSAVTLAMAAVVLAADPIVVNTPTSAPQCGDTVAQWTGGSPPFTLHMNFDGVFETLDQLTERTKAWHTNVPAGTTVFFSVIDSTGQTARGGDFVVQPSDNSSCL